MTAHRSDRRAFAAMLAIPSVPVVKDHVHARRVFRQIVDAEELHDGGAFAAPAARVETSHAQKLSGLATGTGLSH
ncbi:MAG: hypothetical protein ABI186_05650 [Candidatus Elarobacter sp.]